MVAAILEVLDGLCSVSSIVDRCGSGGDAEPGGTVKPGRILQEELLILLPPQEWKETHRRMNFEPIIQGSAVNWSSNTMVGPDLVCGPYVCHPLIYNYICALPQHPHSDALHYPSQ